MYVEIESQKLDDDITVGESIAFASLEELNNKANNFFDEAENKIINKRKTEELVNKFKGVK